MQRPFKDASTTPFSAAPGGARMRRACLLLLLVLSAGCLGDAPEAAPDAGDAPPASAPGLVETPLQAEGASEGVACAPVTCRVIEPSRDIALPADAPLRRIEATFTWTPRDPSLQEMEVFLLRITEDGWEWEESPDTYWVGASPLAIVSELADETPQEYMLHARVVHQPPTGGFEAGLSQPYRVEGALWTAPAAP